MRAFAPGRVNLIGEHTDYNDGLALPFAIEQGVTVTFEPGAGELTVEAEGDGWRAFVDGAFAETGRTGGGRLTIAGDVPQGGGLSSSAALCVALVLALGDEDDPVAVARTCARIENDHVGARTGLLDQLASLLGEEGAAVRIDFATLTHERVPLELGDWRLVLLDSGDTHSLGAGSGYDQRRAEVDRAKELLGTETLRGADGHGLPEPLDRRLRHVAEENARVDAMVAALKAGDLRGAGELLDASHASLRDLYDASTPAVERTVAALKDAGAAGARMMGGGFGGHVLALLPPDAQAPDEALEVRPGRGARHERSAV